MNNHLHQNFHIRAETPLKRSFLYDTPEPIQHHQVTSQARPGVLKRSSVGMTQSLTDQTTTPKNSYSSSQNSQQYYSSYYHQSNYQLNQYPSIMEHRNSQDEKLSTPYKENNIECRVKELADRLERTSSLVDKHERILKLGECD